LGAVRSAETLVGRRNWPGSGYHLVAPEFRLPYLEAGAYSGFPLGRSSTLALSPKLVKCPFRGVPHTNNFKPQTAFSFVPGGCLINNPENIFGFASRAGLVHEDGNTVRLSMIGKAINRNWSMAPTRSVGRGHSNFKPWCKDHQRTSLGLSASTGLARVVRQVLIYKY